MIYESALSFGKNASTINEAYAKMYSKGTPYARRRMITEASGEDVSDEFMFPEMHGKVGRPDWLTAAAKKAGHKFAKQDDETIDAFSYGGHGAKVRGVAEQPTHGQDGDIEDDYSGITKEEDFWEKTIVANPDVFNDENYDMTELAKHKKEIFDKAQPHILNGVDDVESVVRALEEIPGCESTLDISVERDDIDNVGDIDSDEENMTIGGSGYKIVVKSYDRDFSKTRADRYAISWITPDEFKFKVFPTLDEAKDALRNYMYNLLDKDLSVVCIGSIVDQSIAKRLFDGEDNVKGLNATVYTISSSNKENTDRSIRYATGEWEDDIEPCDEYLQ